MNSYYVNKNAQNSGEHEVHKEGCSFFPSDNISLGQYLDCHGAVKKAKDYYYNVDGCYYCCRECHTRLPNLLHICMKYSIINKK